MAAERDEGIFSPIAVSVFGLAAAVLLFLLRGYDRNYTASWSWVFSPSQLPFVALLGAAAVLLALVMCRLWSRPLPLLVALAASLMLLRVPEIVIDAGRYFTYAKYAEVYGLTYLVREWGTGIHPWTDMPLVPLLYGMLFRFLGEERVYIQLFNALVLVCAVWVTGRLARHLLGVEETLAGMLLLASPFLLLQPSQMMVDLHAMLFLTLAIYSTLLAAERPSLRHVIFASLSITLAFFTKYSLMLMLASVALIPLLRRDGRALRGVAASVAGAAVLVGAVLVLRHQVFLEQIEVLRSFQMAGLRRWSESYFSTFFFQVHPFVTMGAIAGAGIALWKRKAEVLIPAYLFGLVFVLGIERIRYVMPLFPMLAVLAGYALSHLRREEARFISAYAVSFSLLVAVFGYAPFIESLSVVNLQKAGAFLDSLEGEEVEVIAWVPEWTGYNPAIMVPLLDLYTHKRLVVGGVFAEPPERERLMRSPVRFTWEYSLPPYYPRGEAEVVAVIQRQEEGMPEEVAERLEGAEPVAEFDTRTELFIIRSLVRVYIR